MILRCPFGDTRTFSKFNNSDIRRARWQLHKFFCSPLGKTSNLNLVDPTPLSKGLKTHHLQWFDSSPNLQPISARSLVFCWCNWLGCLNDAPLAPSPASIQGRVGKENNWVQKGDEIFPLFQKGAQYMKLPTKLEPHEKNGCALLSYFE